MFSFRYIAFSFLFFLVFAISSVSAGELRVHFIDVGQGEAVLFETPDSAVVVDAGWNFNGIRDYLRAEGVNQVDLGIATHPHADHIGGFVGLLGAGMVDEYWMNGQTHTTRTFERVVDEIASSGAGYREPVRGDTWESGRLRISVLHPTRSAKDYDGHVHDHNIVVRADYRGFSVVITGDATQEVELELVEAGVPLDANVLQLGHHGSYTSTHPAFVEAVSPQVAVYQAGEDNQYGHPHDVTVQTIRDAGVRLVGTDELGTVIVTVNENGVSSETSERHARRE